MAREIGTLRLVFNGVSAGLTKMWAEFNIEDDDMKERSEPMKFKKTDFSKTARELWQSAKDAISTKESL